MVKQPMSPGYWECSRSSRSLLLPDVSFPSAAAQEETDPAWGEGWGCLLP